MSEFESAYTNEFETQNYSDVSGSMEVPAYQGKNLEDLYKLRRQYFSLTMISFNFKIA